MPPCSAEARTVTLHGEVDNPNVYVFQNGRRVSEIPDNEWVSVVVAINPGASAYDTLYLSCDDAAASPVTQFDVRNFHYWKDSSWRYDGDSVCYEFTIPSNMVADIYLPDGRAMTLSSGTHKI